MSVASRLAYYETEWTRVTAEIAAGNAYIRVKTGNLETVTSDPLEYLQWLETKIDELTQRASRQATSPLRLGRLRRA